MRHVDYLADKAGCHTSVVLGGGRFTTHPQVVADALVNISTVLQQTTGGRSEQPPEGIPADVFSLILEAEAKLTGWCSRDKALTIARVILEEHPKICVEIGVFGGRSLMPCAAALRHNGEGEIYGIEAWNPNVAIENVTNEVNDDWWSKVDFAGIKREFYRFAAATNLTSHLRVIEAPSGRAAGLFDTIDFLHIDGSHSIINAAEDVILYARKVRSGGIVVFDDVNWASTAPARELLGALCDTVTVLKDPESGLDICAVLRRR
jgi:predicted O-methyltransferase YrrM